MAGITPVYSLPYQTLTDPPNGPTLGQDLADAVEVELQRIDLDLDVRGVLARGRRTTPSSSTTTTVGVLRIDGIPVVAGRAYPLHMAGVVLSSTTANDDVEVHVRVRTGGAAATVTDPVIEGAIIRGRFVTGINSPIVPLSALYVADATTTVSLLMCVNRAGGSGSVSVYADSTYVMGLRLDGAGVAPPLTGVNV